eukprot:TRINITY_DN10037_c0_g2_i2.p1 TRINITY_DN10037_c0_g2~~TRINITY_DN10037_c0_g2_i2.p1  ORF type:complete len:216 (+),score=22.39 TRINITY_DN10037_c0_g2_i2:67-714(+)
MAFFPVFNIVCGVIAVILLATGLGLPTWRYSKHQIEDNTIELGFGLEQACLKGTFPDFNTRTDRCYKYHELCDHSKNPFEPTDDDDTHGSERAICHRAKTALALGIVATLLVAAGTAVAIAFGCCPISTLAIVALLLVGVGQGVGIAAAVIGDKALYKGTELFRDLPLEDFDFDRSSGFYCFAVGLAASGVLIITLSIVAVGAAKRADYSAIGSA